MPRFWREYADSVRPERASTLLARGITRRTLEGPRWRRTTHGLYVPADLNPPIADTPTQRIVETAAILPPGAAIGGWAAAYASGVDALDGDRGREPVTVILPPGLHRATQPGLRYVRAELHSGEVQTLAGIPFTREIRTACDLARGAPDVTEAVVALDAMLAARMMSPQVLRRGFNRLEQQRGVRQARRGVELSRTGTRSPWESRLRMVYVLDLSLPTPHVNLAVFDLDGTFLGAPDLLDEEAGLALEFDGAQHRERAQHRADNVREEKLERRGLILVRADKLDISRYRSELRDRIAAARADGLRRDRSRDRWTIVEPPGWIGLPA